MEVYLAIKKERSHAIQEGTRQDKDGILWCCCILGLRLSGVGESVGLKRLADDEAMGLFQLEWRIGKESFFVVFGGFGGVFELLISADRSSCVSCA